MKEWELKEMSSYGYSVEEIEEDWPRDIYTVEEWIAECEDGCLIDYDGHGEMLTQEGDNFISHGTISPSERHSIPDHITHIEWFNK